MVLVTHQIQFLKSVDLIIVMDQGRILAQGTYGELKVGFTCNFTIQMQKIEKYV